MRRFRCYFIDERAATTAWRMLEHDVDEAAEQLALGLLAGYAPAVIVEMWEGADVKFRYSRLETPQTPSEMRRLCALAIAAAEAETDLTLKRTLGWGAANLALQAEALETQAIVRGQTDPQTAAKA